MIKILTDKDDYEEYKKVVESFDDCLEDWDYIIVFEDSEIEVAENISYRLESYKNVNYTTKDNRFIVVYH